ncbi:hypothetical protein N0V88_002505 [Collariella sp. IMI 366227]|nr:hypothetical protein N0V88_002505 [Collariella sp. IMI 366227]
MGPCLRMLFRSLSVNNFISRSAAGHVFHIKMEESDQKIEAEKAIYRVLMENPHPNIAHCVLIASEGIFLRRMESTLRERLSDPQNPIPARTQERWILQLTSALAWLERLGLVHRDLRPANILLDADDNIQVCDFDMVVKPGGTSCRLRARRFAR